MKIFMASSIDADATAQLEAEHEVVKAIGADEQALKEAIGDSELLVFRSGVQISADVIDAATGLRLLLRAGSGLDNVDLDAATRRGVRVVRVPGSSAQPVAEFTFALLLSLARNVALADRQLRAAHWPKAQLGGPLLHGKTMGVVGAGNIGSRVGQLASAWGMRVLGCVAHPSDEVAKALAQKGITLTDFAHVVDEADFLCLHVPLDDSTRHMVDAAVLSRMKSGSYVVNAARGGVVDERALYAALAGGGPVAGAALDVHEKEGEGTVSPFADLPNVVLTPHIGAMALDSQRLIGERVVELVSAYVAGNLDDALGPTERVAATTQELVS